MARLAWLILIAAACAQTPREEGYVPGGADLPASAHETYRQALLHEWQGERAEALREQEKLARRYPLRVAFHLRWLRLARELKGPEKAAASYEPPPPGVDSERAGVYATLARLPPEDVAGQRDVLAFAVQREPNEPWWRLALADVEISSHDAVSARAERERDLGRVETSEESVREAQEDLDRARKEAEEALRLDPGIAEAETMLGYICSRRADLGRGIEERDKWREQAGDHYAKALALDPSDLPALLNAAENFIYFDRFEDAARLLQQAVELAPKAPLAWVNLGYAYNAAGRLQQAKACYQEALRLRPSDARLRTAYADTLRSLEESDEAVRELERALKEVGEDSDLRASIVFKLAAIHEYEERYRDAIQAYEKYIQLGGSESAKARSRIRHIYRHAFE